jgi:predicted secreted hydrolase
MKRSTIILLGLILVILTLAAWAFLTRPGEEISAQLAAPPAGDATGFARVEGPLPFDASVDFGAHLDYQTEWWYYTGNLETADGRHFGYQLTFFRRALVPPAEREARDSNWAGDQVYMAHFALTDVSGEEHYAFERFARGAAGLAGAESPPYRVWLEDWSVEETAEPGVYRLQAAQDDLSLDLTLTMRKGPVLHGESGYSQKGAEPGNASFYYSQTRLETEGTVQVGGETLEVTGSSWKDHEFSTSALAPDQVGWDWFALQLDDGSELMVFQIRRDDGSIDPFSGGTFVEVDGRTRHLSRENVQIDVLDTWRSRDSGGVYPARWTIAIPALSLQMEIEPYLVDQEMELSFIYWEGAVRVTSTRDGVEVNGNGYVEMTGYAQSIRERF